MAEKRAQDGFLVSLEDMQSQIFCHGGQIKILEETT